MWTGVLPAVTTKFTDDDRLDHAEMERCFGLMMDAGCDGLIVCGSLGEGPMLSTEEKLDVLQAARQVANGKPLLLTINEAATRDGAELAKKAAKDGADGLMVVPSPIYRDGVVYVTSGFRGNMLQAISLAKATETQGGEGDRHRDDDPLQRLDPDRDVVERGLDVVVTPQPFGSDLQAPPRKRDVVVDHRHQGPPLPHQARPVPGDPQVGVEPEPDVGRHPGRGVGHVEIPALRPQLIVGGRVNALVVDGDPVEALFGRQLGGGGEGIGTHPPDRTRAHVIREPIASPPWSTS